jgi:hypothetical protein
MSLPQRGQSVTSTDLSIAESGESGHYTSAKDSIVQVETTLYYGPAYEKALMRRVDRRLLPILGALYAISLVDRVNVCS